MLSSFYLIGKSWQGAEKGFGKRYGYTGMVGKGKRHV